MPNEKYAHIRTWGCLLGSYEYYIKGEQSRAEREGAPVDALYKSHEGHWVTARDLAPGHRFHALHGRVKE